MEQKNKILSVNNVNKFFKKRGSLKHALKNINFDVEEGDFYGIIGESGSGKTTLGKSIIRLYPISGGNVYFYDKLISSKKVNKNDFNYITNNIQMVFQDPMSSLNPKMNILKLVSEPLVINKTIKNEVKKDIKIKQKINSSLQYYLMNKINEIYYPKIIDFYEKYLLTIKNKIDDLNNFSFINQDDWIESFNQIDDQYNDFITEMKININDLSNLIDSENEIINNVLNNEEIDFSLRKYLNNSDESSELIQVKKEYENSKNELSKFKILLKEKEQKKLLKIKINDLKLQRKFSIDNAKITNNKISYWNEKIISQKALVDIYFCKLMIQFKSISDEQINEFLNPLLKISNEYFKEINNQLFSINSENEFNDSIQIIKEKLSTSSLKKMINENSNNIISSLKDTNDKNYNEDQQKLKDLEDIVKEKLDSLNKFKKGNNANNENNLDTSKFYNDYKQQYLNNKKDIYSEFENKISNLLKEIKLQTKIMKKLFNSHCSQLYKLRPSALEKFSKKEQKEIINKNKKSFQIQISTKNKTLSSINWEYKNILNIHLINIKLCSKSKLVLFLYKSELIKIKTLNKVYELLESVGLKREHAFRYPHEFSGGQRQRIVIARALITDPKLIIADEAISALDVSVQAQVINIMKDLCDKKGMTFLFIAHDLSMVQHICNKVIIMHNGSIVEKGLVEKVFKNPIHPYTKSLFMAVPELNKMDVDLASFNDNSEYAKEYSISNVPKFYEVSEGHEVLASESQFKLWMK